MPELGRATYTIDTDAKRFYRDLDAAEVRANKATTNIGKSFGMVSSTADDAGKSVKDMGDDVDKTTVKIDRSTKTVDRQVGVIDKLRSSWRSHRREVDSTNVSLTNADKVLGRFNRSMMSLGNIIKIVKFPALIAGAGLAAQAINALGAAAVGLAATLGPLSGVIVAYPALIGGAVQGMMAWKSGMMGVKESMKDFGKVLQEPTALSEAFADTMAKHMMPALLRLRDAAQKPLLDGLSKAVVNIQPAMKRLAPIFAATGEALGQLANRGAKMVSGWGKDIGRLGALNATTMKRMGNATLGLVDALRHVLIAGRPFINWMTKGIEGFGKWAAGSAKAGRESGRIANFFDRAKKSMQLWWPVITGTAGALKNIGRAAMPLGDAILRSLGKAAKGFQEWTGSTKGQNQMKKWFMDLKPAIFELGRLVRDVAKAFVSLSSGTDASPMIKQLRTELLPVLTKLVKSTTAAFGPVLIDALTQVGRLFAQLAGTSGPLTVFVSVLGMLAGALATMFEASPMLQSMVVSMWGLVAVGKALRFGAAITGVTSLVTALHGMSAANIKASLTSKAVTLSLLRLRAAAILTAVSTAVVSAATKVWTAIQAAFNVVMALNPVVLVIAALVALGIAIVIMYKKWDWFREAVDKVWALLKVGAKVAAAAVVSAFQWVANALTNVWHAIDGVVIGAMKVIGAVIEFYIKYWVGIFKWWASVVTSVFRVAWNVLKVIVKVAVAAIRAYLKVAVAVWGTIFKAWAAVVKTVVRTAMSVITTVIKAAATAIRATWNALKSAAGAIWSRIKELIVNPVRSGAAWVKEAFNNLRKALGTVWTNIVGAVKTAWQKVKEYIIKPVSDAYNSVRGFINKIIGVINKIPGVEIATIGGGGSDATGGNSPTAMSGRRAGGFASARVGPGTHAPASAAKVSGNVNTNHSDKMGGIGSSILGGIGDLASGGLDLIMKGPGALTKLLPDIPDLGIIKGAGPEIIKRAKEFIEKKVKDLFGGLIPGKGGGMGGGSTMLDRLITPIASRFGNVVTSAFRPGDDGWHGQNRARDYSGGNMIGLARFLFKAMGGSLLELIHTPMGVGIKNGSVVPISYFGSAVMADHYDHVHVAMRSGGSLGRKPERATKQTVVYGEDAPVHPEFYIPTNPRYKKRSQALLMGAAQELGMGERMAFFASGGALGRQQPRWKEYQRLIRMASKRYKVAPHVLAGLIDIESRWDPNAGSSAGARGLTQFMPGTAPTYGVKYGSSHGAVSSQILGAAKYLKALGYARDRRNALASYNAGPGNPGAAGSYPEDVIRQAGTYYKKGYFTGNKKEGRKTKKNVGIRSASPKLPGNMMKANVNIKKARATGSDAQVRKALNNKVGILFDRLRTVGRTKHGGGQMKMSQPGRYGKAVSSYNQLISTMQQLSALNGTNPATPLVHQMLTELGLVHQFRAQAVKGDIKAIEKKLKSGKENGKKFGAKRRRELQQKRKNLYAKLGGLYGKQGATEQRWKNLNTPAAAAVADDFGFDDGSAGGGDAIAPPSIPDVLTFSDMIPKNVLQGITTGQQQTVNVKQIFTKAPTDPYTWLRSADFAARAAFGGG